MSVDKLEKESKIGPIQKRYAFAITLVLLAFFFLSVGVFYTQYSQDGDPAGELLEAGNIEVVFTDSGVLVEQSGDELTGEEIVVRYRYLDGESETRKFAFDAADQTKFVETSRDIHQVDYVDISTRGSGQGMNILTTAQLPERYSADKPVVNVTDQEITTLETKQLSAQEFVNTNLNITRYEWTITGSDNTVSEDVNLQFRSSGSYSASLLVEDELGNTVTDDFTVEVNSPDLIVSELDIPSQVTRGDSLTLNGRNLAPPSVTEYDWKIGQETYEKPEVTHVFDGRGVTTVNLTVRDSFGNTETIERDVFVVQDVSMDVTVQNKDENKIVLFSQVDGNVDQFRWNFGEGSTRITEEPTVINEYEVSGNYTITVTAVLESGQTQSTTRRIQIEDNREQNTGMVELQMDSNSGNGWTVDSVSGGEILQVLSDDPQSQNPGLDLRVGERYRFSGLNSDHQIEFRDRFGGVVLSQTENTEYEQNSEVNWIDNGSYVEFTFTQQLSEVVDGYRSSSDRNMGGTIQSSSP